MQMMKVINAAVLCFVLIGCSQRQLFYLRDAELVKSFNEDEFSFQKSRAEPIKLLLNGHYIRTGSNLVLLIRKFDPGELFAIDDETYEKLTIEIRSIKVGVPMILGSGDIRFYYSTGSCAFIRKGDGFYSIDGSGELTIIEMEKNRIIANVDFSIFAKPAGVLPSEGKTIRIRKTLTFDEIRIGDLTPWLGVPDPSPGNEVYP